MVIPKKNSAKMAATIFEDLVGGLENKAPFFLARRSRKLATRTSNPIPRETPTITDNIFRILFIIINVPKVLRMKSREGVDCIKHSTTFLFITPVIEDNKSISNFYVKQTIIRSINLDKKYKQSYNNTMIQ
jgi:hypothetical protein